MKILINRSDAIGDLLLTLPMAKALRLFYGQQVKIFFLVRRGNEELLKHLDYIDEIYIYHPKQPWSKRFFFYLRIMKNLTHYFYVGGDRSANWPALLKVPFRGGLISKFSSFITLNNGVRQKRTQLQRHESRLNLELFKTLDSKFYDFIKSTPLKQFYPSLSLSDQEKDVARDDLSRLFSSKQSASNKHNDKTNGSSKLEFVLIHPGMTGHTLNWPIKNYISLIEKIISMKKRVLISYTPSDANYINPILNHFKQDANNANKDFCVFFDGSNKGLRHFLSVIDWASLVIAPSTGVIHLGACLNKKLIGFYSPIASQCFKRWGPYTFEMNQSGQNKNVILHYPSKDLVATDKDCGLSAMDEISVDQVLESVKRLLA